MLAPARMDLLNGSSAPVCHLRDPLASSPAALVGVGGGVCGGSVGGTAGSTNVGGCAQEGFLRGGRPIDMSPSYNCWSVGLSDRTEPASSSFHDSQTTGQ